MSGPKISVLIPIYDVEDYLSEALDSLLKQSMIDDIEVIMVDDGSTDESRYIAERYALDYDNFHAYHRDNEGPGNARNYALEHACGDYVHFFDSDDFMAPHAYDRLYKLAMLHDSDIVIGNVLRFSRYNAWDDVIYRKSFEGIEEDIPQTTLAELPQLVWDTSSSNKIYKRDFLMKNNIAFLSEKTHFEDLLHSIETYIRADSIAITGDVLYYWRLRSNNTSITQQDMDVTNFTDRLKILNLIRELMVSHNVSREISDAEYMKWLDHDLKFFIKRFDRYPEIHHMKLFREIRQLLEGMPPGLIESLNSYKKAVYRMILNNDFKSFIKFAPLEDELLENPTIPDFLDDEYRDCFDFERAVEDMDLRVELTQLTHDESGIFLEYNANLDYGDYEISPHLVDGDEKFPLESYDSKIRIPFSLIRSRNHTKIEFSYRFRDFTKFGFLKSKKRMSVEFDDFFVDLNRGVDSHLFIDVIEKGDNHIEIRSIDYSNGEFVLKATSLSRISQLYIQNVISFEKVHYPVEYIDGSDEFVFTIPDSDISNAPIKKWELNCTQSPNSIRVSRPFEFFTRDNRIRFINSRNKILIENDIYNVIDELYELNNKNNRLKKENRRLAGEIDDFRSRKVVRIAERLKLR